MKPWHVYDTRDTIISGRGEDIVVKKREITLSYKIKAAELEQSQLNKDLKG